MTRCGDPAHADWHELAGKLPADYLFANRNIEGRVCVCGGMVWADPADPRPGVDAHNATLSHMAWAELQDERAAWGEEPCAGLPHDG